MLSTWSIFFQNSGNVEMYKVVFSFYLFRTIIAMKDVQQKLQLKSREINNSTVAIVLCKDIVQLINWVSHSLGFSIVFLYFNNIICTEPVRKASDFEQR